MRVRPSARCELLSNYLDKLLAWKPLQRVPLLRIYTQIARLYATYVGQKRKISLIYTPVILNKNGLHFIHSPLHQKGSKL